MLFLDAAIMSDVEFSYRNFLNPTPALPAKNSCVVGPNTLFLAPCNKPVFSKILADLLKLFVSTNVDFNFPIFVPGIPILLTPKPSNATGSANICAIISIAPVM